MSTAAAWLRQHRSLCSDIAAVKGVPTPSARKRDLGLGVVVPLPASGDPPLLTSSTPGVRTALARSRLVRMKEALRLAALEVDAHERRQRDAMRGAFDPPLR